MHSSQIIIPTQPKLTVKNMSVDDLVSVIGWCEEEGWNIEKKDALIYHRIDPKGHLLFLKDGNPIGAISVIRHTKKFLTLGPFIVKKEYRHQGYGAQIWQTAMELIQNNSNISLHAVPLQIQRYKNQGFKSQYANQGWTMTSALSLKKEIVDAQSITPEWLPTIVYYDKSVFGVSRKKLLKEVFKLPYIHGVLLNNNSQITGFGFIRPCADGFRVGPLFADTLEQAKEIFSYLIAGTDQKEIIIDIPTKNPFSILFAEYFLLTPITCGETNTMLKGDAFEQNLNKNFGAFSLEIG